MVGLQSGLKKKAEPRKAKNLVLNLGIMPIAQIINLGQKIRSTHKVQWFMEYCRNKGKKHAMYCDNVDTSYSAGTVPAPPPIYFNTINCLDDENLNPTLYMRKFDCCD